MSREVNARVRVVLEALRRMGLPGLRSLSDADIPLHERCPNFVPIVFTDMTVAWAVARGLFPPAELRTGRGQAFRHAFWAAMVARDGGIDTALHYTTRYENRQGNRPAWRAMNLYNNNAGALIGAHGHYLGARAITRRRGRSDGALAIACYFALRNGRLRLIRAGRLVPSS